MSGLQVRIPTSKNIQFSTPPIILHTTIIRLLQMAVSLHNVIDVPVTLGLTSNTSTAVGRRGTYVHDTQESQHGHSYSSEQPRTLCTVCDRPPCCRYYIVDVGGRGRLQDDSTEGEGTQSFLVLYNVKQLGSDCRSIATEDSCEQ
jgi:hypothetical protein